MYGVRTIFAAALTALAAAAPASAWAATSDPFETKTVRWEENFGWAATSPRPLTGLDRLKYLPLDDQAEAGWLTLGGEARTKVDASEDARLGLAGVHEFGSLQTRVMAHADLRLDGLRLFGQLSLADERGRRPRDRSVDESAVDLEQGFLELSGDRGLLRLGRQELPLGDQRLSNVRETTNLRRSFDAARLDARIGTAGTLTVFSGSPVANGPDAFDDGRTSGERFEGVYFAGKAPRGAPALDLFWLSRRKPAAAFSEGIASERRETFGALAHGTRGPLDYSFYALGQTGRFGAGDIRAWAASADLGWTAGELPWSPRFSLRADAASGDRRRGDGELNSFDAPYGNTSYLSTSSAYWPGNAWSVFPLVTAHPTPDLELYLGAQTMSRMSKADGFYYSAQNPIAPAAGRGQVMMRQVYARARWVPARRWVVSGTVIRQTAGQAIRAAGGKDSNVVSVSASWKF